MLENNSNGLHMVRRTDGRKPDAILAKEQVVDLTEAQERLNQVHQDRTNKEQTAALARRELDLLERELRILTAEEELLARGVEQQLGVAGLDRKATYTVLPSGEIFLQTGAES